MDFLSLSRRELQALCKKNKIPANITNVAMVEALKALEMVEGIEELMQPSQTGTAQSSIESLEMPEVTSPFVPPTAGRSTRRTNLAKGALESVNPVTRTRPTTRKIQVKDADVIETPAALRPQTNRKKGQMASARRNMDSQLKECANKIKRDVLITPGISSRRKKIEESGAYSTRRSVRLAEKNDLEVSNENENDESQLSKNELVTKDGENEEMNLKDSVDNFNLLSGTTDVDAISTVEDKSENKEDESGVVSDKSDLKQDTSVVKDEFEAVSDQKQDTSVGEEIKMDSYGEEEECTDFEREVKLEEDRCDTEEDMPLKISNEVQQNNDGSQDVYISEKEFTVEKSTGELKPGEGEASQDETANFVEDVILENGDNFVVNDESSCDDTGLHEETKEEFTNEKDGGSKDVTDIEVTLVKLTELTLQQDSDFIEHLDIPVQLNEDEPNEIKTLQLEEIKKADDPVQLDEPNTDFSEQNLIPDFDVEMTLPSIFEEFENESKENDSGKVEILQLEESKKAADSAQSDEPYADFSEQIPKSGEYFGISFPRGFEGLENDSNKNKPNGIDIVQLEGSEKAADQSAESCVDFSQQIPKSGLDVIVQRTCLTPSKDSVSKASMTMKRMTSFSDNKENIVSGGKLVIMKEVKKNVDSLDDYSMRKLTKMLKEKLEITKNSSKMESDNEAMPRPALQAISKNLLVVDEKQN